MKDNSARQSAASKARMRRLRKQYRRRMAILGVLLFIVGAVAGVLVAVPLLLAGRRTLLSRIPFGPYLSLGALLWLLWGRRLVLAYLLFAPPWRVAL